MKLLFPGTFDPFTVGHADLVERALRIADEIIIAVGINESKHTMFDVDDRISAIKEYYKENPRVKVMGYDGFTSDVVKSEGANAILRGVRSVVDYEYERNMADVNFNIEGVETIFLYAAPANQYISSSLVREMIRFGRPIDKLVIDTFHT
ncbi:MAG: pantetheine-phosphate adenylyltransferase [Bacteroidaceae bacterium]|nr:pantetheine-phosphate adenylyltransferase [Bacteroidaceae bacterium]